MKTGAAARPARVRTRGAARRSVRRRIRSTDADPRAGRPRGPVVEGGAANHQVQLGNARHLSPAGWYRRIPTMCARRHLQDDREGRQKASSWSSSSLDLQHATTSPHAGRCGVVQRRTGAGAVRWGMIPAGPPATEIGNRTINRGGAAGARRSATRLELRAVPGAGGVYEWRSQGASIPKDAHVTSTSLGAQFAWPGCGNGGVAAGGGGSQDHHPPSPQPAHEGHHKRMPAILRPSSTRVRDRRTGEVERLVKMRRRTGGRTWRSTRCRRW